MHRRLYHLLIIMLLMIVNSTTIWAHDVSLNKYKYKKQLVSSNTTYIIKRKINLKGKTINIPDNCCISFKGGNFKNGTLIGNSTKIIGANYNCFKNCIVDGIWLADSCVSIMFDNDLSTSVLFQNLSRLSNDVRLSSNREYHLDRNASSFEIERLSSTGATRATICFHTNNPNECGLILKGDSICISGLDFCDDYDENNDVTLPNDHRNGSTIGFESNDGKGVVVLINNCSFHGGTPSSYLASSNVSQCVINNCMFSDYMSDHAVYFSKMIESFIINNCVVNDVSHTTGLFKVRSSTLLRKFSVSNVDILNLDGSLAIISLLEGNPQITFSNITLNKSKDNNYTFLGVCITDENATNGLKSSSINAERVSLKDSYFGYGRDNKPFFAKGAGVAAKIESLIIDNVTLNDLSFLGGSVDNYLISNSMFTLNDNNKELIVSCKDFEMKDTKIIMNGFAHSQSAFLFNYGNNKLVNLSLSNVSIDANASSLLKIYEHSNDVGNVSVSDCIISGISDNILQLPDSKSYIFHIENNIINNQKRVKSVQY